MKKLISYTMAAISAFTLITCTSCGGNNKPLESDEFWKIIEDRYDTKIELASVKEADHDKYYTFRDQSGFEFQAELNCIMSDWGGGATYYAYEYYIPAYYKAHPELFDIFSEGEHHFEMDDKGHYSLYFNGYEDIDDITEFAYNCIKKIEFKRDLSSSFKSYYRESESCYLSPRDVTINFIPAEFGSEWDGNLYICLPVRHETPGPIAEQVKKNYIQHLQLKDDSEHLSKLPSEDIQKYTHYKY